jgi:hypothetical protein
MKKFALIAVALLPSTFASAKPGEMLPPTPEIRSRVRPLAAPLLAPSQLVQVALAAPKVKLTILDQALKCKVYDQKGNLLAECFICDCEGLAQSVGQKNPTK